MSPTSLRNVISMPPQSSARRSSASCRGSTFRGRGDALTCQLQRYARNDRQPIGQPVEINRVGRPQRALLGKVEADLLRAA
jgi:hypothetical protein